MRELREKSLICNVILETRDELRGSLSLLSRSLEKEWRVRERLDRKTMGMVVSSKFKMIYVFCGSNSDNRTVFGDAALGGQLQFVKFERRRLDNCLDFIKSKMHINSCGSVAGLSNGNVTIKATCGGAFKFADVFEEKLGVSLDKLDEIDSVVAGANLLLKKIPGESFTHVDGKRTPIKIDQKNLFSYLLVNIGSDVGIIKVTGNKKFERMTGTHIGGGSIFGLAKLLTGCTSYDEFLRLSQRGDNLVLDLIVKDICRELACQKVFQHQPLPLALESIALRA